MSKVGTYTGGGYPGGGPSSLREHNQLAVLRALLDAGETGTLSRSRLATNLDLTPPALSSLSAELLGAGLLETREPAAPEAGQTRRRGRQEIPLALAPLARQVVTIHIGATGLDVGLADLRARTLTRHTLRIDHPAWGASPAALASAVAALVEQLLQETGFSRETVLGAGAGIAGWVDGASGIVRSHAQLGWRDVPLAALLSRALDLPVVIEDHVRAMALAEAWYGAGRETQSLALLYVGAVAGCALAHGRRVHRGRVAAAGVAGFLPAGVPQAAQEAAPQAASEAVPALLSSLTDPPLLMRPPLVADSSSLEETASEPALFRQAQRLAVVEPDSLAARWVRDPRPGLIPLSSYLAEAVTAAGAQADAVTLDLLRRRAARLAPLVAHLIAVYDPDTFVLAGPMAWERPVSNEGLQLRFLREAVVAYAPPLADRLPPFVATEAGRRGAMAGPASLVLQEAFSPPLGTGMADSHTRAAIRRRLIQRIK